MERDGLGHLAFATLALLSAAHTRRTDRREHGVLLNLVGRQRTAEVEPPALEQHAMVDRESARRHLVEDAPHQVVLPNVVEQVPPLESPDEEPHPAIPSSRVDVRSRGRRLRSASGPVVSSSASVLTTRTMLDPI